jgi:hypothetical protein
MGGDCNMGALLDDLLPIRPQYPVAGQRQNHFKLYDFPLVTRISLLY